MPTYDFVCVKCNSPFEQVLSFADFDRVKGQDAAFLVDCPNCDSMYSKMNYDDCAHSHVIDSNIVGIFVEKNAKKIGKTKIEEETEKRKEATAPKAKPGWYGK